MTNIVNKIIWKSLVLKLKKASESMSLEDFKLIQKLYVLISVISLNRNSNRAIQYCASYLLSDFLLPDFLRLLNEYPAAASPAPEPANNKT